MEICLCNFQSETCGKDHWFIPSKTSTTDWPFSELCLWPGLVGNGMSPWGIVQGNSSWCTFYALNHTTQTEPLKMACTFPQLFPGDIDVYYNLFTFKDPPFYLFIVIVIREDCNAGKSHCALWHVLTLDGCSRFVVLSRAWTAGQKKVRDAKEADRENGGKIKEIKPDRTLGRKDPRWGEEFGSWQSSLKTFPLTIK